MRLALKLFLATSLVIGVVILAAGLSLRAVARVVAANRDITTRTVPAVRHAAAARDGLAALARLEGRMLVLGDPRYAALWEERAARVDDDLAWLETLLADPGGAARVREARAAFDAYRRLVTEEVALAERGLRQEALRRAETDSAPLLERAEGALERLMEEIHAGARAARAEAARLERRTWTGVVGALGGAVALALLATAAIAYRLTRSLRALADAAATMARGAFPRPVRVEGRDEVAALAGAFNTMAARLREVDQLKETFLATVSHELRSPLTSMREAAHLLREQVPGELNAKQMRLVAIVEQGTERLLRLVNQVLDFSRLRAGKLPLERRPLMLDRVVARAVEELRPQAAEAGVHLGFEQVGERFGYVGDEDRLVQVVVNLGTNAIRFTPRHGRVTVRVVDAGPELEIQVEDTGTGIPAAALPRIFGWYEQADWRRGGTGLGLPIVRGLVEAHGGRVTVESQEGKGSRFTVLLPRTVPDG
jgi:two-component system sensor histidine kinase GlrK